MKIKSGMTIIECEDISEVDRISCCHPCHNREKTYVLDILDGSGLIGVRPMAPVRHPDWRADWSLYIKAEVCCKNLDFILARPHSWWVDKARELRAL